MRDAGDLFGEDLLTPGGLELLPLSIEAGPLVDRGGSCVADQHAHRLNVLIALRTLWDQASGKPNTMLLGRYCRALGLSPEGLPKSDK